MPYALAVAGLFLCWLTVRHINGRKAPILIGLLVLALAAGGFVEMRHRMMQERYTAATRELLDRDDTFVVCERLSGAMLNVWNRAGYVEWTDDGSKPSRADITWDTCRNLADWEASGFTTDNLDHVVAVHVLTHETMHLAGYYNEAEAECAAVQRDARMAQILGAPKVAAEKLAKVYYQQVYPRMRSDYVSVDCKENGPMDKTPRDNHWP